MCNQLGIGTAHRLRFAPEYFAMNPTLKSSLIGTVIGAVIGLLPGLFSAIVGNFVTFLRADVGIQNASSLVIYLGIVIGGAAGAVVAALSVSEEDAEADIEPVAHPAPAAQRRS
jgi:TctA family transporter